MEFESISKLWKLLSNECKIEKIYPSVFASDAETNIVTGESNFDVYKSLNILLILKCLFLVKRFPKVSNIKSAIIDYGTPE